jgi:hypothetical protein
MVRDLCLRVAVVFGLLAGTAAQAETVAFRASILNFTADPRKSTEKSYRYFEDGLLVVKDGHVESIGEFNQTKKH